MSMATGAALLRSAATKISRAPPRLPTSSGGLCLPSRFSTSTGGSTPSSANLRGPQTNNNKIPSGNGWYSFIAGVKDAVPMAACGLLFGGFIFIHFYFVPALDRVDSQMEALRDKLHALNKEMEQQQSGREHAALDTMGSQMEARDVVAEFSKGHKTQASGQCKEHL